LLDRIFRAWLDEAALISGYLPQPLRKRDVSVPHNWHWDSNELGDPLKLAKAKQALMAAGLSGIPGEYSAKGEDWNKALIVAARGYGITVPELQALICASVFATQPQAAAPADEEPAQPPQAAGTRGAK
jgi:capsid protein